MIVRSRHETRGKHETRSKHLTPIQPHSPLPSPSCYSLFLTREFHSSMDGTSAAGVVVGFAVPVFQCAKALRDKIKQVRYPEPHIRYLELILYWSVQVASEKVELLVLLSEYEKDINLLESLYNDHKDILDQHHLDIDLRELAGFA